MKSEEGRDMRATDFAAAFARGLTNPDVPPPEGVVGALATAARSDATGAKGAGKSAIKGAIKSTRKGAQKRYNVYRNNVTVSLIDALAAIYPAVQRITGADFFRAMARFHMRATPPVSPLLFEYGRDFPRFIEQYEYAKGMPWLADVARIERAWLDAYHAADLPVLPVQIFEGIDPAQLGELRFTPHPAARVVRSAYSAVSIFATNRRDGPTELPEPLDAGKREDALATRPEADVIVSQLPDGGAAFLNTLIAGESLGVAVAAAFDEAPSFDLPASLNGMIVSGVFTAIQRGD
ncbi:HvfC/BufC N-terminal domain-containing protein [Paraburkholderia sp. 2C]